MIVIISKMNCSIIFHKKYSWQKWFMLLWKTTSFVTWNRNYVTKNEIFMKKNECLITTISKLSDLVILKHDFQYLLFLCRNYDDCSMLLESNSLHSFVCRACFETSMLTTTYYNHRSFYTKIINIESRVSKLLNHSIWKL